MTIAIFNSEWNTWSIDYGDKNLKLFDGELETSESKKDGRKEIYTKITTKSDNWDR